MDNNRPKESFAAYVTRITGFSAAICIGGLFLGLPDILEPWAKMIIRYAVVTWVALVGAPVGIKWIWTNNQKIKGAIQGIWPKSGSSVKSVIETVSSITPAVTQHSTHDPDSTNQQIPMKGYFDLPEPLNYLPVNPVPVPRGALTEETAPDFVRNTIQMAGITMDENPEILKINSGPTLQSITFQLPRGLQLSTLVKKKEDLANHTGLTQGFSVESGDFASSATFVVPQEHRAFVYMRDVAPSFIQFAQSAKLPVVFGKDIKGDPILMDLSKLPHLLVSGTTGSGKSVFINTLLESLTSVRSPQQLKLLLIDPKVVELKVYNGMPHLLRPTVVDPKQSSIALMKMCVEMDKRYDKFASVDVRNIEQYNKACPGDILPYIVIVVDEYADLMMVARGDVEDAIVRIAQKARAAGIHLILGTQRPSADVVTGLIKANLPSRVAFQLPSSHDYRTILEGGNRSLLGKGDGVCRLESGKLIRFQSAAISGDDEEMVKYILETKKYWNGFSKVVSIEPQEQVTILENTESIQNDHRENIETGIVDYNDDADRFVIEEGQVSIKDNIDKEEQKENSYTHIAENQVSVDLWDDGYELTEEDGYDLFVSMVEMNGGFSPSIVKDNLKIELSEVSRYIEQMVKESLLGDYDQNLKMRPYLGNQDNDSGDNRAQLLETIKDYICRTRSTRTEEIRGVLSIQKAKVLSLMKELAAEGFLNLPTSPKSGYTIAWDEDQIKEYLSK